MRIWKFELPVRDIAAVEMPEGARILCVQTQFNKPYVWALCDQERAAVSRRFAIYGTGHATPDDPGEYIGTFQIDGGHLVFHVFEIRQ
jgi:hypothetical protein